MDMNVASQLTRVLQTRDMSLDILAIVEQGIVLDDRFNRWFLAAKDNDVDEGELIDVLERSEPMVTQCCAAAEQYHKDRDATKLSMAVREYIEKITGIMSVPLRTK